MSWQVDYSRGMWRRCGDCGESYTDRNAHLKSHIDRPSDNHMTPQEVAAAVNRPINTVRYWIRKKWLRADTHGRGNNRLWITRKALKAFVEGEMSGDLRKLVKWAEGGGVKAGSDG